MVHLINPRANHQAHGTHYLEGLAEDTTLWFTWEDLQHRCLKEQSVGTRSWAAAQMGLLRAAQLCQAAQPFPGPATSQISHEVSHTQWTNTCFLSRHCVICVQEKQQRDPSNLCEGWREVRQTPGSSCPTAQPPWAGEGTAPFSSAGPLRDVVQSYCLGCDERAAATRAPWQAISVASGTWHSQACPYTRPGHGISRMPEVPWVQQEPVPCRLWRAWLLQQEQNWEHPALAGAQQKMRTSCKLWQWWPGEQQGESTPPVTLLSASTQHDLAGQTRSLHSG